MTQKYLGQLPEGNYKAVVVNRATGEITGIVTKSPWGTRGPISVWLYDNDTVTPRAEAYNHSRGVVGGVGFALPPNEESHFPRVDEATIDLMK